MTKDEIQKNSEHWYNKYKDAEKRIADLEEENAELKTKKIPQLERRIASIRGSHRVDVKKLNARIEQVERLKKENAELKEQCSILADCNTCISACKTENIEMKNNLTKAKEIIKAFLDSSDLNIKHKAEEFLGEF